MFGHVMSLKYVLFFFFKQKTAYEMRISDWSSDVCSSDLVLSYDGDRCPRQHAQTRKGPTPGEFPEQVYRRYADNIFLGADFDYDEWGYMQWIWKATHNEDFFGRSEEHTSELQSLMRISYAVFCLKKKKKTYQKQ